MATKSQEFQAQIERAAHAKRQPQPHKHPASGRLSHNEAHRLDKKSTHAIEEEGPHQSRKSTRGSANRAKPDSAQRLTARIRNDSPETRARRGT